MKRVAAAICIGLIATAAYANCRHYTYTIGNKTYYCTECCYGSGIGRTCNTTCT